MNTFKSFESKLYTVNEDSFADIALELFRFQAVNNPIYSAFLRHLKVGISAIDSVDEIPCLPISFFKHTLIKTGNWVPEDTFTSSGTTESMVSHHPIPSLSFYRQHAQRCFEFFFGPLEGYHILALLPSYLERQGSSLVAMMDYFITQSHSSHSGFYLHQVEKLVQDLEMLRHDGRKAILWGVSFALLDMADQFKVDLSHVLMFETGGMKGRRKEITRQSLHDIILGAFGSDAIFSEYGMTELQSQAYTRGGDRFFCPPWMKIGCRDLTDPRQQGLLNETGGINIIDLANWHSVAFIETEDLGKVHSDGTFQILGRMDNSDVRGCNLLIT